MRTISAAVTIATAMAVCWCAPPAHAAFTHLSVETYQVTVGGVERTQHRLWANFTSVTDGISSWGAIGTNLTIQNIQANGELSLNGFLNAGGNGDLPPPPNPPDPDAVFDSYYMINGFGGINPSFPMPPIIDGIVTLSALEDMAAIFVSPDLPWALAGWLGGPPRVLLMQALVTSGEHIRGTIGINTIGSEAVIVATFNSVPAPGALVTLAMVGLWRWRGRARSAAERHENRIGIRI